MPAAQAAQAELVDAFRRRGFEVHLARGWTGARAEARRTQPDVVVMDLSTCGKRGIGLLAQLKQLNPRVQILVIDPERNASATQDLSSGASALFAGTSDVIALLKLTTLPRVQAAVDDQERPAAMDGSTKVEGWSSLARAEWVHIQRVLRHCQGNVTRAARLLGIHRRSLQRKLRKYPPSEPG
jgi:two-component system response regulator RegA